MGWEELVLRNTPSGALVGLVVLAVLAIWRGWLVPRRTVDALAAATGKVEEVQAGRLADSVTRESEWKAAWIASEEARRLQADQIADLLELARTTAATIQGLKQATGGGP